ncbi:MAG: hypothetical protein V7636_270, partial [Actinomycetota bacterium]
MMSVVAACSELAVVREPLLISCSERHVIWLDFGQITC